MRSTVKTHFTCTVEEAVKRLTVGLWDAGCTVQGQKDGWRVLRFRRDERAWTQAHHGLGGANRRPRAWLRWSVLIEALKLTEV